MKTIILNALYKGIIISCLVYITITFIDIKYQNLKIITQQKIIIHNQNMIYLAINKVFPTNLQSLLPYERKKEKR